MNRRNILKRLGIAAGMGTVGVPSVTVEAAPPGNDLEEYRTSFTRLEVEMNDADDSLPQVAACGGAPHFIRHDSTDAREIYVGRYSEHGLQPRNNGSLLTYHRGIRQEPHSTLGLGAVPINSNAFGGSKHVDGTLLPDITLENVAPNSVQGRIGDSSFSLDPRGGDETLIESELVNGQDVIGSDHVTLQIRAAGGDNLRLIGHPDHAVIPNTPRIRRIIRMQQRQSGGQVATQTAMSPISQSSTSDIRVLEHDNGIEIIPRGEE